MKDRKFYEDLRKRYFLFLPPLLYLIIVFTPIVDNYYFLPDALGIFKLNPQDFFGLIIGAIASILGILIAVILLTVEFSKERIKGNRLQNPLENQVIRNAIHNSMNLIGLSFIGYIQFEEFNKPSEITIAYFIALFLLFYIYSIYNVIKHIVDKSSRIKENLDIVKTFNLNSFKNLSIYRLRENDTIDERPKQVKEEIDFYIINNNILAYENLNFEILNQLFEVIEDGQDRENCDIVFSALTRLWRDNTKTALRANDFNYFEMVWRSVQEIYIYFANNKAPLLHLQVIDLFLHVEYFKLHIKSNNAIPLYVALDCIEKSFFANLIYNCPEEKKLKHLVDLYDKENTIEHSINDEIQWDQINSIFSFVPKIQEVAIEIQDRDLFKEATRIINSICSDLYWNELRLKLSDKQRAYIVWSRLTTSFYQSEIALDKELFEETLYAYDIPERLLTDLLNKQLLTERDIRVILQNLSENLIKAYKQNKLSMERGMSTLHDFCMIGIHSLKDYFSKETSKQTVDFIVKVLIYLKEYTEESLPQKQKEYAAIKGKLEHFTKVAVDMEKFNPQGKPVKKWKKIIRSFEDLKEDGNSFHVKWKLIK